MIGCSVEVKTKSLLTLFHVSYGYSVHAYTYVSIEFFLEFWRMRKLPM